MSVASRPNLPSQPVEETKVQDMVRSASCLTTQYMGPSPFIVPSYHTTLTHGNPLVMVGQTSVMSTASAATVNGLHLQDYLQTALEVARNDRNWRLIENEKRLRSLVHSMEQEQARQDRVIAEVFSSIILRERRSALDQQQRR